MEEESPESKTGDFIHGSVTIVIHPVIAEFR
jgi:hypothetical protein